MLRCVLNISHVLKTIFMLVLIVVGASASISSSLVVFMSCCCTETLHRSLSEFSSIYLEVVAESKLLKLYISPLKCILVRKGDRIMLRFPNG